MLDQLVLPPAKIDFSAVFEAIDRLTFVATEPAPVEPQQNNDDCFEIKPGLNNNCTSFYVN